MSDDRQPQVEMLAHLIESIIKAIVDDEGAVQVKLINDQLIHVTVAKFDYGKVLGLEGRNMASLRCLFNAVNAKFKLGCTLFVEDPDPSRRGRNTRRHDE